MYCLYRGSTDVHNEAIKSRQNRDNDTVQFPGSQCVLTCITSRHAAEPCYERPGNIVDARITITCKVLGQQEVKKIGQDRLIVAEQYDMSDVSINEPRRKNNAPTFATLLNTQRTDTRKLL